MDTRFMITCHQVTAKEGMKVSPTMTATRAREQSQWRTVFSNSLEASQLFMVGRLHMSAKPFCSSPLPLGHRTFPVVMFAGRSQVSSIMADRSVPGPPPPAPAFGSRRSILALLEYRRSLSQVLSL